MPLLRSGQLFPKCPLSHFFFLLQNLFQIKKKKTHCKTIKKKNPFQDPNTFRLSCLCLLLYSRNDLQTLSFITLRFLKRVGQLFCRVPQGGVASSGSRTLNYKATTGLLDTEDSKENHWPGLPAGDLHTPVLPRFGASGVPCHGFHAIVSSLTWRFTKVSRHKDDVRYSQNK